MGVFNFEVSKEDLVGTKPVASGAWYKLVWKGHSVKPTSTDGTDFLSVYANVDNETSEYHKCFCSEGFTLKEPVARGRLVELLKACGESVQAGSNFNLEFMKGKHFEGWIEVEEFNEKAYNKIKRFRPIGHDSK
jgi:hypothetical protein